MRAHDVVPISRKHGVDVLTGEGLADALTGADCVIDVASGASSGQAEATEFFTAAARNLQQAGERVSVARIIVVSIIGCDRFSAGYNAAKAVHEQVMQAGPVPVTILRAAQFHEFVSQLVDWCTQGEVSYLPKMRTQLVAALTVAEAAADLATGSSGRSRLDNLGRDLRGCWATRGEPRSDGNTPRQAARLPHARVEEVSDPDDPDRQLYESGALLPGPHARLAGPTFRGWLESKFSAAPAHPAASRDWGVSLAAPRLASPCRHHQRPRAEHLPPALRRWHGRCALSAGAVVGSLTMPGPLGHLSRPQPACRCGRRARDWFGPVGFPGGRGDGGVQATGCLAPGRLARRCRRGCVTGACSRRLRSPVLPYGAAIWRHPCALGPV